MLAGKRFTHAAIVLFENHENIRKVVDWVFKTGIKAITIYSEEPINYDDLGLKSHLLSETNFIENGKGIKIITKNDSEPDFNSKCSLYKKQRKQGEKAKDYCLRTMNCYEHIRELNKGKDPIEVDYCPNIIFTFSCWSKLTPSSLNNKSFFGIENVDLGHFPWLMREASEMM